MAAAEKSTVWAIKFGDRTVELRDVPIGILAGVARETGHTLLDVVGAPYSGDGAQLVPLIEAVAGWVDGVVTLPSPLTFKAALELVQPIAVEDDLPAPEPVPGDDDPPTGTAT